MRKIKFLTLILACTVASLAVSPVGFAARVFADDATAKIEFSRTPSKAFTDFEKEGGIKNIEDLVGEANSYKLLNEGAYIDENKNVVLESRDSSPGQDANNGRLRSLTIKNDYKDIGVKYKFKKDGDKEIMILNEVRGTLVESFYWATSVNPQVMFVYNPDSKLVRFAFTVNGLGDLEWDKCNSNLELKADEYITVEYGAINVNDDFLLFIRVTNGSGATAYGEALYREATVNQSGFIKIYNSCYNSFMRGGGADGVFSSPNNMQNVTIEGINAPTMSKYVFKGEKESNFKTYDISDILPVGEGATFTWNAGDKADSPSRSLLNRELDSSNFILKTRIRMGGSNKIKFTITARSNDGWDNGGYKYVFTNKGVLLSGQEKETEFAFEANKDYVLELACLDWYFVGEVIPAGVYLSVSVDGKLVTEVYAEEGTIGDELLGNVLSGMLRGEKGNSITFSAANKSSATNEITVKATKSDIKVGKKTRFEAKASMPTLFDEISYEIVSGDEFAAIEDNALTGVADGEVKVRAVLKNSYGTFYSEPLSITVGEGEKPENTGSTGKKGCSCGVGGTLSVLSIVFAVAVILKRKKCE